MLSFRHKFRVLRVFSRYPATIPAGTSIPAWAYLDITVSFSTSISDFPISQSFYRPTTPSIPRRHKLWLHRVIENTLPECTPH